MRPQPQQQVTLAAPLTFQCHAPAEAGGMIAVLQFDSGPSHHAIEWPLAQIDMVIERLVALRDAARKAQSGLVSASGAPLPLRQHIIGGPPAADGPQVLKVENHPAPIPHEERAYYGPPPPLERAPSSAPPAVAVPEEDHR